jgi:uncharacterized protein
MNQHLRYALLLLVFITSFIVLHARDMNLPERPNPLGVVNDLAGMLSKDDTTFLGPLLTDYNATGSYPVIVVTVTTLDGNDIEEYGNSLLAKWHIGKNNKDNGVLLLLSKNDKQIFIATGRDVKDTLPDALSKHMVKIEPMRKEERHTIFSTAIYTCAPLIVDRLSGHWTSYEQSECDIHWYDNPTFINIGRAIIVILIIGFILAWFFS